MVERSSRTPRLYSPGDSGASCEVQSDGRRLLVSSADQQIELRFEGLQCRQDGFDHEAVFLSHPGAPEHELLLSQHDIEALAGLPTHPAIAAASGRTQSRVRRFWGCLVAAVLLLVVALGAAAVAAPWLLSRLVDLVPWELEQQLGELFVEQLRSTAEWNDDPSAVAALTAVAEPLLAPRRIAERPPVELHLTDAEGINAFALPGGQIVVHEELVLEAEEPAELLGVLAHELAHVDARHSLRGVLQELGLLAGAQLLFGDASSLARLGGEGTTQLMRLGFSRELERDADDLAWAYLDEAGIDPEGLLRFFARLKDANGSSRLPDFLETHPQPDDRIERLEQRPRSRSRSRPLDTPAFDRLRSQLE